ncbi:MAG: hypothetical protein E7310_02365 [Clostridiales bacterium]|nr:hypothetical protein [Clostridiales bacterium]
MNTYQYPCSDEGIAEYLKEVLKTESPYVRDSKEFRSSYGELGGKREITYHFCTEDGKKYKMVCEGFQKLDIAEMYDKAITIKSITLIDDED